MCLLNVPHVQTNINVPSDAIAPSVTHMHPRLYHGHTHYRLPRVNSAAKHSSLAVASVLYRPRIALCDFSSLLPANA